MIPKEGSRKMREHIVIIDEVKFLKGVIEVLDAVFYSVPQPSKVEERWEIAIKGAIDRVPKAQNDKVKP